MRRDGCSRRRVACGRGRAYARGVSASGRRRTVRRLAVAISVAAVVLCVPAGSRAATVAPDTTADDYGSVATNCSLREAVRTLNTFTDFGGCTHTGAFGSADTIRLSSATYELTIDGDNVDVESGDLNLFGTVLIEAPAG